MMKSKKITKDTNIAELTFAYPEAAEILTDYGLHCVGCGASGFDTIESGAKVHGMNDTEIDELVDRIAEVVEHAE